MVLHAMIEHQNCEKALIVTVDGDFYCLVDYLAKKHKLLKLMAPNQYRFSSFYRKMVPNIVFMNNMRNRLEYKNYK